jgi:hypothetical protein
MPDKKMNIFKPLPEFQYDLISRIIPGLILFTAIGLYFGLFPSYEKLLQASVAPVFAGSAFVIMICWAIGICLSSPGSLLSRFRVISRWNNAIQYISSEKLGKKPYETLKEIANDYSVLFPENKPEKINADWYDTLMTNMLDKLKTKDPHALKMIPKIAGESAFGFNLCAASIIWFIIVLLKCFHESWSYFSKMQLPKDILKEQYIVPVWSFVFIIMMFVVMQYRSKRFIRRTISCHFALKKIESKQASNPPSP